ncbi:gas vesicle protein [Thermopolyspora sp. NPDC052614]|uniref:gas vesicle protein n=1 Tax=Thermopolyspora sp. NPDC052614 TaxID=3155682 RepID=UPI003440CE4C
MTIQEYARAEPYARERPIAERLALVDLLDRLLAGGVVLSGDLVISVADIDLVRVSLRALIMSVRNPEWPDDHGERR